MCQLESWEKMKSVFTYLSMNSKDFALRKQSYQKQLHRAWLCCAYIFPVQRYLYSVIVERGRDKEKAEEKVISGAVSLWGLKVFIKNRWEECMTTSLPLIAILCFCAFLPLSLSLPPTSGIYKSYCDWIDCTWEVYLTKQLKVQLVHLDEIAWVPPRVCPTLHLASTGSLCLPSTQLWKMPLFNAGNPKFWHIQG